MDSTPVPSDPMDRLADAPPPRTLVDVLRESARRHPDAPAIEDEDGFISYAELLAQLRIRADLLARDGVRRGDRVGIQIASGGRELYLSILAVIAAGAAYVPVDADDPPERARLVFSEAGVRTVLRGEGSLVDSAEALVAAREDEDPDEDLAGLGAPFPQEPTPQEDAWIIFTSGSTGVPKGVAVTHRNAAAFVDAEAGLFLEDAPLGPGDRVLAGLSVAFDASCEEMWLAWRHGACLVPAPRALVRSGEDLGPWLQRRAITVVSTVPTLAALWPAESVENVRLLIFGGEACPPELGARLASPTREVWNTYGPTEATVVACAAPLDGSTPVRIGLPLAGWSLAVVDAEGHRVPEGGSGELVIGGVGLARYLDPAKDAEKYAPMPTLGWERAYRSGDLVRNEAEGLVFLGRADDQVKVGGRRIELGEVEAALQNLPGVSGAAAAVRRSAAGTPVLVGYLTVNQDFQRQAARAILAEELPAALVPLLAVVPDLPTRTSGKVDKDALPWPLPGAQEDAPSNLPPEHAWLAQQWQDVLGMPVTDLDADFFDLGGGSLTAAQLVSRIRTRLPEAKVGDIYDRPRFSAMAAMIAEKGSAPDGEASFSRPVPTPRLTQVGQTLASVPLLALSGVRWLLWVLLASAILRAVAPESFTFLPALPWPTLLIGTLVLATPWGRMAIAVIAARVLLAGLQPGDYRRGGSVHMRLWIAQQVAEQVDAVGLAGAPWVVPYARALGATIGKDVVLHSLPPVTGMLRIDDGASIEPEVDLAGYWIDGDTLRVGGIRIGANASIGARSTLAPGARIGKGVTLAPASAVFGKVPAQETWGGSPAVRIGAGKDDWPRSQPPRHRGWWAAYAAASVGIALLPILAFAVGALILLAPAAGAATYGEAIGAMAPWLIPATLAVGLTFGGLVLVLVRLLALGLAEGDHPVHSRIAWQAWSTERLLDSARTILFPIYSSLFTPVWLRMLGARVGRDVEASTVLLLPSMSRIADGAFLADDTMVASYELRRGWMRIARARVGKRAFLGNSGMAAAGHKVPKDGLVAVLSVTPSKAKAGSSWLGSPPVRLRRVPTQGDERLTYRPDGRLRVLRAAWEVLRIIPVILTCALGVAVLLLLAWLTQHIGLGWTVLLSGLVAALAGAVAAGVATAAKWAIVGPIRPGEHPLWSSFVWRTEVSDTFVEMLAAPWFARAAAGTPALAVWLRSLGASIGRGAWCDSYWLPEPDAVTLGDGATVNRGCVVQTHLFHDRVMSVDTVVLGEGATLGPHSVILPAASIGAHATVGPASLVMRGEDVPIGSRWSGNPIGPWQAVRVRTYQRA
ncbi:Pls/PosA family non-ribosomal peptide synthetase [Serinibacter salmoneus]|nr:Pls/PosA family non-ribosomal peptide synthetase [Serinibacter salmoneus]